MINPLRIEDSPEKSRLYRLFPELGLVRRTMYIGASQWRALMLGDLLDAGQDVDILEPHLGNCKHLWDLGLSVIQGAMPDAEVGHYDIAVCLHVIEHIPRDRLDECLRWLQLTADLVIITCPMDEEKLTGKMQPGGIYAEDDHEAHLWSPSEMDFAVRGWSTEVLDRAPYPVPELCAWRRR